MIRTLFLKWLGYPELLNRMSSLEEAIDNQRHVTEQIQTAMQSVIAPGIGRIISKIDPDYRKNELDPKQKAKSDRLANEVLLRLQGESAARRKMDPDGH